MKIYEVGGAVRDALLGLPVKERDWVVVGASADDLLAQGFKRVGKDFPVFLHPKTGEEYALARTERKTAPGYTGFAFDTSTAVTLEQDLARRDLTINAIARTEDGQIVDPWSGRADLERRVLRHVSPAFREDPLRVLRVARFAARFGGLGFTVAEETLRLMREIVASGEMGALRSERVWQETVKALGTDQPDVYFTVLRDCGALQQVFPEVDALFGVPQPERWHPEIDSGVHTLLALRAAARLSRGRDGALRRADARPRQSRHASGAAAQTSWSRAAIPAVARGRLRATAGAEPVSRSRAACRETSRRRASRERAESQHRAEADQ